MKKCITAYVLVAWVLWSHLFSPSYDGWDPQDTFTTKSECEDYAEQWVTRILQHNSKYSRNGPLGYITDKNASVSLFCFPDTFDPTPKS